MTLPKFENYAPAHLSYSTVDGYRTCGHRFLLQKVLRKEQRPGLAGIAGNAVHAATERYDELGSPEDFSPQAEFELAWGLEIERRRQESPSFKPEEYVATGRAKAEYGGKRTAAFWLDEGPRMVQRWIDWRTEHGWHIWETPQGTPAIEVELRATLPGDVPVLMYIDRIMVTPAGQIVVVDIKTGRQPETPEQLGLYAVGIEQIFGPEFRPDWGYFWDAQKGVHSQPLGLERYTADYFADMYHQAVAGINAGCFLARPANSCKDWCGVARFCTAVGGSLS